jgi:hypothetical protein
MLRWPPGRWDGKRAPALEQLLFKAATISI